MARVQRREENGGGVDDVAARQAAEEAARRRAEEEARRRAEEAAAQRAAEASRRVAEAAKQNSAMESARRVGRQVRDSVKFEPAGRKMPMRQERSSMKFAVANARAELVKGQGALEAAKAGVLTKSWEQAAKAGDVEKLKALAVPKIEATAVKAADLVDEVVGKASKVAQGVVMKESLSALGAVAKAHEALLGHELKGRAGIGADGIRENLPPLAHKVATLAQWADEGLKMGDVHATAEGVRQGLWEVKDVVGALHDANEGVASLSKWDGTQKVRTALGAVEGAVARLEAGMSAAEGKSRFAQMSAVEQVNRAREATGFERVERDAPPEQWMPGEGERPSTSNLRKSDDAGSEVERLSAKLDGLKARRDAGENVDAELGSAKANLRSAEARVEAGSSEGAAGAVDGLPEGASIGPDGVPVDKDGMPLGLSEEEIAKLGTAVPADGGAQVIWNRNDGFPEKPPGLSSAYASKAVEQGLLTKEQEDKANSLANKTLPSGEKRQFEVGDTALLAKQYGIDTAKMDPNQLAQATRMLNSATTVEEQRACVSVAVRNFQLIADNKTPQFSAEEKKNMMWAAAKIPGHAVEKLKPNELDAKFKEVTGATNAPGDHQFKLGKYNTTIKVSEDGKLEKSTCKKPSFLSKLGKVAKIALKVGSFIPGPIGIGCRIANAVIGMVGAIKNGNWLGALAAAAGGVAAGAAGFAGNVATKIGNIAKGVQSTMAGIQAAKNKSLGGLLAAGAGVLGATAGAFGDKFKDMGAGLSKWSERVQKAATGAGAVEGVVKANAAVGAAKAALEKARASGDPQAVADAMKGLEQAERGKKSALLGAGAAALSLGAGTLRKDPLGNPLPAGARSGWQVGLEAGAGALNVARNLNDRNYAGALLDAAQLGQDLRQGTKASSMVNGDDGDRRRRFGVQEALDAAQGLNGWRDAEKAASQAKNGISAAESRLEAAQRSGDPAAVRQAQDELKKAKRSASDAELGVYTALQRANESVDAGLSSWKATNQHDARVASQIEDTRALADDQLSAWKDVGASDKDTQVAAQASREGIAAANEKLAEALEKKDKAAISRAMDELDVALEKSEARLEVARARPPEVMQLPVGRNFNDLLASVPGTAQDPAAPPPIETTDYKVKRGDALEKIAVANGLTLKELMEANGITDANKLREGQDLKIPVRTSDEQGRDKYARAVGIQKESNRLNAADQKFQAIADDATQPESVRKVAAEQKQKLDALQTTYEEALRRDDQTGADAAYAKLKAEHGRAEQNVTQARTAAIEKQKNEGMSKLATLADREVQAALAEDQKVHSFGGDGPIDFVANLSRAAKDGLTGNQEKMHKAADAYQAAAGEMQRLANRKGGSTDAEKQAAYEKFMAAKSAFSSAYSGQLDAQSDASVFDVAKLGAVQGGKAIEEKGVKLADTAADFAKRNGASDATVAGIRDGLKEAAKQSGGVFEGLGRGVANVPDGMMRLGASMATDPKGTTEALVKMGYGAAKLAVDADPMQRMAKIAVGAATGKYKSLDDVVGEIKDLGRAQKELATGLAKMVVSDEAADAWKKGEYGKAVGIVIGENADYTAAAKGVAKMLGKGAAKDAAKNVAKNVGKELAERVDDIAVKAEKEAAEVASRDAAQRSAREAADKAKLQQRVDDVARDVVGPGGTKPSAPKPPFVGEDVKVRRFDEKGGASYLDDGWRVTGERDGKLLVSKGEAQKLVSPEGLVTDNPRLGKPTPPATAAERKAANQELSRNWSARDIEKGQERIDDFLAAHPELAGVPREHLESIYGYSMNGFVKTNEALATRNLAELRRLAPYIDSLSDGLRALPAYEGKVVRGIEVANPAEVAAMYQAKLKSGTALYEPRFLSFSADAAVPNSLGANNIVFEVQSKTGRQVRELSYFGYAENEVLFDRGSAFKVTGVTQRPDGSWLIRMMEGH